MNSISIRHREKASRQDYVVALLIATIALLTVAGVWAIQWAGYAPCEICLAERIPYYVGIPCALVTAALQGQHKIAGAAYVVLILIFAVSAAIGSYHAGLEWHFWAGPTTCTSNFAGAVTAADLLKQLNEATVVRCDVVAMRLFGLSLAVWNMLVSVALVALAIVGLLGRATATRMPSNRLFKVAR